MRPSPSLLKRLVPFAGRIHRSSQSRAYGVAAHAARSVREDDNLSDMSLQMRSPSKDQLRKRRLNFITKNLSDRNLYNMKTRSYMLGNFNPDIRDLVESERLARQRMGTGVLSEFRYGFNVAKDLLQSIATTKAAGVSRIFELPVSDKNQKELPLVSFWKIICNLQTEDNSDHTIAEPLFILGLDLAWNEDLCSIGSRTWSGSPQISVRLYLSPKRSQASLITGTDPCQPGAKTNLGEDKLSLVVESLARSFRRGVHGRSFKSPASLVEAAALHVEKAFHRSSLCQYLQLKQTQALFPIIQTSQFKTQYWYNGPLVDTDLHGEASEGNAAYCNQIVEASGERHAESLAVNTMSPITQEATGYTTMSMSLDNGGIQRHLVLPSFDPEAFESKIACSGLPGLAAIVDGTSHLTVSSPVQAASSIRFETPHQLAGSSEDSLEYLQNHSVELRNATSKGPVNMTIKADLNMKLRASLKGPQTSHHCIEITGLVLKMAPVGTSSLAPLREHVVNYPMTAAEEVNSLVHSACQTLQRVCDCVQFDSITSVPDMLAEAILRVASPLTPVLNVEEVSLLYKKENDLVELQSSVSAEDVAITNRTQEYVSSFAPLEKGKLAQAGTTLIRTRFDLSHFSTKDASEITGIPFTSCDVRQIASSSSEIVQPPNLNDLFNKVKGLSSKVKALSSLVDLSREIVEYLPGAQESTTFLSNSKRERESNHIRFLEASSKGTIRFSASTANLTVGVERHDEGRLNAVTVTWDCVGYPSESQDASVKMQLEYLQSLVVEKLHMDIAGKTFRDGKHLAEKVLDAITELKHDFSKHLMMEYLSVIVYHNRPVVELDDGATTLKKLMEDLDAQLAEASSVAVLETLMQDLDSKLELAVSGSSGPEEESVTESPRPMERGVVIALGSNVGNRIEEIEKACRAIDEDPDMRIIDTSCLYETEPMYVEDQQRFVNGACEIETSLTPLELLDRLQAIEQGHGRVKLIDKGPRNIDLDIAIFRNEVVKSDRLTIPHMLMHEREFVIRPIMDLKAMKTWRYPLEHATNITQYPEQGNKLFKLGSKNFPHSASTMDTITPLTATTALNASSLCRPTHVMSILNTTPDSFSDGGSNALDLQSLSATAAAHIAAGATIIDVGGQSSRPNAPDISAEEEIARVLPAIAAIKSLPNSGGIAISVDTYRAVVAEAAVNAGAHIVNDISAGMLDPQMLSTVAKLGCTYIMMHMRGTPHTMQNPENCLYPAGVRNTVGLELNERVQAALAAGIRRWRIILDRGIGFAKTQDQNLALLRSKSRRNVEIDSSSTYMPHLIGTSRKGFIGKITGVNEPKERVWGTAATVTAAVAVGADIVRVHDVKEMAQVAKMADAIYRYQYDPN